MTEKQPQRFDELSIEPSVLQGIQEAGFVEMMPIQAKTLPDTLEGADITGQAQTGSGKTAAFLIAGLHRMKVQEAAEKRRHSDPRMLVIAPTRELAVQIADEALVLSSHTEFKLHTVYGGVDYQKQMDAFDQGVDILVGTPGRLIDFLKRKLYRLDSLEILVVDECDRMFDMGFVDDIRWLLRRMPPMDKRQNLLFSATLNERVKELGWEHMSDPPVVQVDPEQNPPEEIEQVLYHLGRGEKDKLLVGMLQKTIREDQDPKILVFSNYRNRVRWINDLLEANGIGARALSGSHDQKQRLKALEAIKEGNVPVIVATDVASRGLHIDDVTHVINYDVPQDPDTYIHRIGRTARAGATGIAITLATEDTVEHLPKIEAELGIKIPVNWADEAQFADIVKPQRRKRNRRGDNKHNRNRSGGRGSRRPRGKGRKR